MKRNRSVPPRCGACHFLFQRVANDPFHVRFGMLNSSRTLWLCGMPPCDVVPHRNAGDLSQSCAVDGVARRSCTWCCCPRCAYRTHHKSRAQTRTQTRTQNQTRTQTQTQTLLLSYHPTMRTPLAQPGVTGFLSFQDLSLQMCR